MNLFLLQYHLVLLQMWKSRSRCCSATTSCILGGRRRLLFRAQQQTGNSFTSLRVCVWVRARMCSFQHMGLLRSQIRLSRFFLASSPWFSPSPDGQLVWRRCEGALDSPANPYLRRRERDGQPIRPIAVVLLHCLLWFGLFPKALQKMFGSVFCCFSHTFGIPIHTSRRIFYFVIPTKQAVCGNIFPRHSPCVRPDARKPLDLNLSKLLFSG